jgi:hypothetical protein
VREAFPFGAAPRFLIHDRDAKYGTEVPAAIRSLKINAVRTSFESPWQNGVAERWVGSCRRELLDHVIALNERHLKRLLSEYVSYHHEDRPADSFAHLGGIVLDSSGPCQYPRGSLCHLLRQLYSVDPRRSPSGFVWTARCSAAGTHQIINFADHSGVVPALGARSSRADCWNFFVLRPQITDDARISTKKCLDFGMA